MIKTTIKSLAILIFLTSSVLAQNKEYQIGMLIDASEDPGKVEEVLLTADPMIKHESILSKYKRKHQLDKDYKFKVLWGGEIELIDGKFARFNETSGTVNENPSYKETASIKNIENFIRKNPHLATQNVEFLKYDPTNEHFNESMVMLAEIRHEIPARLGLVFAVIEMPEMGDLFALTPSVLDRLLNVLFYVQENSPGQHPMLEELISYCKELLPYFLEKNYPAINNFSQIKLERMIEAFKEFQNLEYMDIIETPSAYNPQELLDIKTFSNTIILTDTQTKIPENGPDGEASSLTITKPVKDTENNDSNKLLNTKGPISVTKLRTTYETTSMLQSYTGRQDVDNITKLVEIILEKIKERGNILQEEVEILLDAQVFSYLYLQNADDEAKMMLCVIGALCWDARKSGAINLNRDQLLNIYNIYADANTTTFIARGMERQDNRLLDNTYIRSVMMEAPTQIVKTKMLGTFPIIKN